MEFIGVKELSQNLKKYMGEKDWVIITLHGKPKKILKEITPDELTQCLQGMSESESAVRPPLSELKSYGMWKKRKEMKSGVDWVNQSRKQQETRYTK